MDWWKYLFNVNELFSSNIGWNKINQIYIDDIISYQTEKEYWKNYKPKVIEESQKKGVTSNYKKEKENIC